MPATERIPPPSTARLPNDAAGMIAALARVARPAGGPAEAAARAACAVFLTDRGFTVRQERFAYSAFPGRWGTPAAGVASIILLATAGYLGGRERGDLALGVLALGAAGLAAAGAVLARIGVLGLPVLRREGVNLVAERGAGASEARVWLVAHLDSKSQPVPIGVRAAGIVVSVVAWIAAFVVGAGQTLGAPVAAWWPWVTVAGVAAGIPVASSVVGARSPGAIDNATGVAAVLLTVAALDNRPLGVLLTSAEELGLAGARAWAVNAAPATAINFDSLDDAGSLIAMYTGRRPGQLLDTVRHAAGELSTVFRERRLLPGILVDAVALADRGWQVVTLSRGTLATLSRIHRPGDTAARLSGGGVGEAARVAAATVELLAVRDAR